MSAIIFCGGEIQDYAWLSGMDFRASLIVCADGGVRHAQQLGIVPQVIIGDHDSFAAEYPDAEEVLLYPTDKDYTDTHLCVNYAMERGHREITLLGALGGRRDHEFSHFCLLLYGLRKGVKIRILDRDNEIWMEDTPFSIKRDERRYVSFFPYGGPVTDFCVHGLKYQADHMTLDCGNVQASSNEFADQELGTVSFSAGTLLVMRCRDARW